MAVNKGVARVRPRSQRSFSNLVPEYFLNKQGKLEESPLPKDTQKIIESAEYTRLDEIYDQMLEIGRANAPYVEGREAVEVREGFEDDLSLMLELDALRDRYSLENPEVANMTHSEMRSHIEKKLRDANEHIEKIKKGEKLEPAHAPTTGPAPNDDNNGGKKNEKN